MIGCLIAYDEEGNIVGVLDYMVKYDETRPDRPPLGLVDFEAMEAAGIPFTNLWSVDTAKGSKPWPEWLGNAFGRFRVELAGPAGRKHIAALVHKESGHRRERDAHDAAVAGRIKAAGDEPADIRDLVGGPGRPLALDSDGRTKQGGPRASEPVPTVLRGGD